jgi:Fur family ferric uptake transcriptional regulator
VEGRKDAVWQEHASARLAARGHRRGGARAAVIELLGHEGCCLSAQEIHDRLRADRRRVGLASVYRALELLSELALVQRVDLGGGTARFEAAHPGGDHHHHVVCGDCGRVEAFEDEGLEAAIRLAAGSVDYRVDAHEVVLHGTCGDCHAPA